MDSVPSNLMVQLFDTQTKEGEEFTELHPDLQQYIQMSGKPGLYDVIPAFVYQFRNVESRNMTVIRGLDGWIIIDPLNDVIRFRHALKMLEEHVGPISISAIILTRNQVRWWANLSALNNIKNTKIYTPESFLGTSMQDLVLAGNLHQRRNQILNKLDIYKASGSDQLPITEHLLFDTIPIKDKIYTIDGTEFQFIYANEHPPFTDFVFFVPKYFLLFGTDLIVQSLNNKSSIGTHFSVFLDRILLQFGNKTEVLVSSEGWPTFSSSNIIELLKDQRDVHRLILQQTMFYANQGYQPAEINLLFQLPESLALKDYNKEFHGAYLDHITSIYYQLVGTTSVNAFDMIHLEKQHFANQFVNLVGEQQIFENAKEAFDRQDYPWSLYLMNALLLHNDSVEYKDFTAQIFHELSDKETNLRRRNILIANADDIVHGIETVEPKMINPFESWNYLSANQVMEYISVHLDLNLCGNFDPCTLSIYFTDKKERVFILWSNGAFIIREEEEESSDLYIITQRDLFVMSVFRFIQYTTLTRTGLLKYTGNFAIFESLVESVRNFDLNFSVHSPSPSCTDIPNVVLPLL